VFTGQPQRFKIKNERFPLRKNIKEFRIANEIAFGTKDTEGALEGPTNKRLIGLVAERNGVSVATVKRIWKEQRERVVAISKTHFGEGMAARERLRAKRAAGDGGTFYELLKRMETQSGEYFELRLETET
jgi:hypothetical protein